MKLFFDSTLPRGGDYILRAPVAIILGIGIVASVGIAQVIQTVEIRRNATDFRLAAEQAINSIQDRVDSQIDLLRSIVSLYNSVRDVDRVTFQSFVADSLRRHPSIQVVGWAPRVLDSERAEFELNARQEGLTNYSINERTPDRRAIPAQRRPEYFPNLFLEPPPATSPTYGLDQGWEPARKIALDAARDSGELVLSERLELALVTDNPTAINAYAAVYTGGRKPESVEQRRENLAGYFYGIVRPALIVEEMLKERSRPGKTTMATEMHIDVYDTSDSTAPKFLFSYDPREDAPQTHPDSIDVGMNDFLSTATFGGREWTFIARPSAGVLAGAITWQAGLGFAGALCLSLLFAAYMHAVLNRSRAIESEVSLRTNELRLTNELLRDSEDRIRVITDSVPALIAYVDRKLIYRFANRAYKNIGIDPGSMLGKSMREVRGDESWERVRHHFERAARGEYVTFETSGEGVDGVSRCLTIECTPDIFDGEVRGFYILARDVTSQRNAENELKRAYELLRDSEDRIRAIANSVPALIAYIDKDLIYRFANERYWDIGIDPRKLIGQSLQNRRNDGSYEIIRSHFERAARGEAVSFEIAPMGPDGKKRYRNLQCTPDIVDGECRGFYLLGRDITDQRNAENEIRRANELLRGSEERVRIITDSVPVLIAYVDENLIYRFANRRYREVGVDPESLIGKSIAELNRGQPFEAIRHHFERAAAGEHVSFEIASPNQSGTVRYSAIDCTPNIVDGIPRGFYILGRDITAERTSEIEIRRTYDLLRSSEERLRVITNALPALIAHIDRDMKVDYANERFGAIAQNPDEVIGRPLRTVLGEKRYETLRIACQRAMLGEASQLEFDAVAHGGREISVLSDFTPDIANDGTIRGFYFVALNVTAQRALEIELDRFFRQSLSFMCVATYDGFLRRFNDTWTTELGYTQDEIIASPYINFVHPADRPKAEAAFERLMGEGELTNLEIRFLRKDGAERVVLWNAAANRHERQIYATGHDITELKAVDRMKDEFVSTVSHELRTPLTSIKGALGLIRLKTVGTLPPDMNTMLDIAYKNCDRLVLLINDILDIEKIEAGKMDFHFEPVEIIGVIRNALAANQAYADQFGVKFTFDSKLAEAVVGADEGRLMQVMANLLSNAAKFSPENSEVRISARRFGRMIRISVADDGPGISEDFRGRIFEKFSQSDSSDQRKVSGTGLGLSIVRAIVEQHGGRVDFESQAGKGSTFYFDIPEIARNQSRTRESEERQRILVCEDDPNIAEVLASIVRQCGYDADIANSADEARALLRSNAYAGMTLDIVLPDIDGIQFFKELRAEARTRALPVVIVSANTAESAERLNGSAVNIVDWLEKPIDETRLAAALHRAAALHADGSPRIIHIEDDPDIVEIVSRQNGGAATFISADSIASARRLLGREHFDLAILDLLLPDGRGEELLPDMVNPDGRPIPVVVFSAVEVPAEVANRVQAALVKTRSTDKMLRDSIDAFAIRNTVTSQDSTNTTH